MAKQKEFRGSKMVKMQSKRDGKLIWVAPECVSNYERSGYKQVK